MKYQQFYKKNDCYVPKINFKITITYVLENFHRDSDENIALHKHSNTNLINYCPSINKTQLLFYQLLMMRIVLIIRVNNRFN